MHDNVVFGDDLKFAASCFVQLSKRHKHRWDFMRFYDSLRTAHYSNREKNLLPANLGGVMFIGNEVPVSSMLSLFSQQTTDQE